MYKFLTKNGQLISFLVGLAITVIFFAIVLGGIDDFNMLSEDDRPSSNLFNFGLLAAGALSILCAVAMIFFIFFNIVMNIKGNIKLLIGLTVVGIIFIIMFSTATFETEGILGEVIKENSVTPGQNGFIVGGLWTAVILTVIAFVSFIALEILNFFK